jgi:ATP-dependent Zn protease
MTNRRFTIWHYVAFFAILLASQYVFMPTQKTKELSYSQFKDSLSAGRVDKVTIKKNNIEGYFKARKQDMPEAMKEKPRKLPRLFSRNDSRPDDQTAFKVVRVDDKELIPELERQNVEYKGKVSALCADSVVAHTA